MTENRGAGWSANLAPVVHILESLNGLREDMECTGGADRRSPLIAFGRFLHEAPDRLLALQRLRLR